MSPEGDSKHPGKGGNEIRLEPVTCIPVSCAEGLEGDFDMEQSGLLAQIIDEVKKALTDNFLLELIRDYSDDTIVRINAMVKCGAARTVFVLCLLVPALTLAEDSDYRDAGTDIPEIGDTFSGDLPESNIGGLIFDEDLESGITTTNEFEGDLFRTGSCKYQIFSTPEQNVQMYIFPEAITCGPFGFGMTPESDLIEFTGSYFRMILGTEAKTWIVTDSGSMTLTFSKGDDQSTDGMLAIVPFDMFVSDLEGVSPQSEEERGEVIAQQIKSLGDSTHYLVKPDREITIERGDNNGPDSFTVLAISDGASVVWNTGGDMLGISDAKWEELGEIDPENVTEVEPGIWRVPERKGAIFSDKGERILVLNYENGIWSTADDQSRDFEGNDDDVPQEMDDELFGWSCSITNIQGVTPSCDFNPGDLSRNQQNVTSSGERVAVSVPGEMKSAIYGRMKDKVVQILQEKGLLKVDPSEVKGIYLVGAGIVALLGTLFSRRKKEEEEEQDS